MNQTLDLRRREGLTVIFTAHIRQQALAVADEVLLLTKSGPAETVLPDENLTNIYGTEVKLVEFEHGGRKAVAVVTVF
ncbi:MAG: hypothetical protein LBP22_05490 [Deltaproteobacteria bacterium]|jgi:ABC-type cobalamin/Fe3+-siderophores transport system ATPase subunit|nr:hypothetical protein [Deltaproteobacteria bacterium]